MLKLTSQDMRCSAFDCLNSLVNTKLRVNLKQKMDMVGHDFHLQEINPHFVTNLFNEFL